jgi:hypothetical protein
MRRSLLLIPLLALALGTAGCGAIEGLVGGAVGGAIEKTTGVSVSKDGQQISIKDKDGNELTVGGGELAQELRDFPVPSGYTLQREAVGTISSKEGRISSGTWKGNQTVQQVVDYYKRELPGRGWKEDFNTVSTDGALVQFTNEAQKKSAAVTVSRDGTGSLIAVLMTTRP